jgi:hypothetical protein
MSNTWLDRNSVVYMCVMCIFVLKSRVVRYCLITGIIICQPVLIVTKLMSIGANLDQSDCYIRCDLVQ